MTKIRSDFFVLSVRMYPFSPLFPPWGRGLGKGDPFSPPPVLPSHQPLHEGEGAKCCGGTEQGGIESKAFSFTLPHKWGGGGLNG
jgi:hypothetical protein